VKGKKQKRKRREPELGTSEGERTKEKVAGLTGA